MTDLAEPAAASPLALSDDQQAAFSAVAARLGAHGIDLSAETAEDPDPRDGPAEVMAVLGKAGSGKTLLLARLVEALKQAGVEVISQEWEGRAKKGRRTFAVLAPTNKAASVLRNRGVPATTLHRILYTPVYDPEYEKIAAWLSGEGDKPEMEQIEPDDLDRAMASYQIHGSIPGALATLGLRGSDFITGWARREDELDLVLVDESSMLDDKQLEDIRRIFQLAVLFGDPAQLAPVGQSGAMVFDALPAPAIKRLERVHRQAADNPILDLAHALADPDLHFDRFESLVEQAASRDDRVVYGAAADSALMARSPMLVWRNATRKRLIAAFRAANGAPEDALLPGEPLICDGIELPLKHRRKRIDLEARGLVKGAQCVYLGPGRKPGFARLHVMGAEEPQVNAASIIQIERPDVDEPFIPQAARMGAVFLHGAAATIHKAQGSQWPTVQVFAPDLYAAARMNRDEAGIPLWKRLAYVAVTRAEHRLVWVTRYKMKKPTDALSVEDLKLSAPAPFKLTAEEEG